jgi:hypothetical protein
MTCQSSINESEVMLLGIARPNGLRGLEHNGDVPIHRFQAVAWEPQATRRCQCRPEPLMVNLHCCKNINEARLSTKGTQQDLLT